MAKRRSSPARIHRLPEGRDANQSEHTVRSPWQRGGLAFEDFHKARPDEHAVSEEFAASSEISPVALEATMARFFERVDSLSGQVADVSVLVAGLSEQLREFGARVADLEESLSERPVVRTAFLRKLSRKYTLAAPVPVVLEEYEGEVVARWPEVEATGVGASELEAIASLREDIVALYDDLQSSRASQLGAQAAIALSILKSAIS